MKKLALCALILGVGLAASRADVSLGIRIGIDDRYDHHVEHRSSHDYNHYLVQHRPYVPAPAAVVRYETVEVTCPVCGRPLLEQRPVYPEYRPYQPAPVCADHRSYVIAEPACSPRGRGW